MKDKNVLVSDFDVFVVGFGLVGVVVVGMFGWFGYCMFVIDRLMGVYDKLCVIVVDYEIMCYFDNMGIVEDFMLYIVFFIVLEYFGVVG